MLEVRMGFGQLGAGLKSWAGCFDHLRQHKGSADSSAVITWAGRNKGWLDYAFNQHSRSGVQPGSLLWSQKASLWIFFSGSNAPVLQAAKIQQNQSDSQSGRRRQVECSTHTRTPLPGSRQTDKIPVVLPSAITRSNSRRILVSAFKAFPGWCLRCAMRFGVTSLLFFLSGLRSSPPGIQWCPASHLLCSPFSLAFSSATRGWCATWVPATIGPVQWCGRKLEAPARLSSKGGDRDDLPEPEIK